VRVSHACEPVLLAPSVRSAAKYAGPELPGRDVNILKGGGIVVKKREPAPLSRTDNAGPALQGPVLSDADIPCTTRPGARAPQPRWQGSSATPAAFLPPTAPLPRPSRCGPRGRVLLWRRRQRLAHRPRPDLGADRFLGLDAHPISVAQRGVARGAILPARWLNPAEDRFRNQPLPFRLSRANWSSCPTADPRLTQNKGRLGVDTCPWHPGFPPSAIRSLNGPSSTLPRFRA
jgi:hypothetical protein